MTRLSLTRQMPPTVCSVLVADDDHPLCDLLDVLLSEAGYHVRCAYDGEAAWAAVQQAPPDLILSDIKMPKLDGIQLAVRLAATADGIPVILMSAGDDDLEGVARAFVRKPFDVEVLLGLVAAILNEQAAQGTEGGRTWRLPTCYSDTSLLGRQGTAEMDAKAPKYVQLR